jgi:hypothetical protein
MWDPAASLLTCSKQAILAQHPRDLTSHGKGHNPNQVMTRTLLAGLLGLVAVSAGAVWLAFRSSRRPYEDHVSGSELARINVEYRDNP